MAGGLLQIASPGAQDLFLTCDPQMSFFKQSWRKYTNFSFESHTQSFLDNLDFGTEATVVLDKYGDLLSKIYLIVDLPGFTHPSVQNTESSNIIDYLKENDRVIQLIYNMTDTDQILETVVDLKLIEARKRVDVDVRLVDIQILAEYWINRLDDPIPRLKRLMEVEIPLIASELVTKPSVSGKTSAWVRELGHRLVHSYEISAGGTILGTYPGEWLTMSANLFITPEQRHSYDVLIGNVPDLYEPSHSKQSYRMYIPLRFWFTDHYSHALPISAFKHDVTLTVRLNPLDQLIDIPNLELECSIMSENIFLDTLERDRFIRHRYDYLATVVQHHVTEIDCLEHTLVLPFNHPTKYITWKYTYQDGTTPQVDTISMSINNQLVSDGGQDAMVYAGVQQLAFPNTSDQYVYSFALNPADNQPSGSINLSRIDQFGIKTVFKDLKEPVTLTVIAESYNVLRVTAGLVGFAYV